MSKGKKILVVIAVVLAFYAISQLPDNTKEYGDHVCTITTGNADCK